MVIQFKPKGVCAQSMEITVEDGVVCSIQLAGGCSGNLQGIRNLVIGMPAEEVIHRLEGIRCGFKDTSCPDQLAQALRKAQSEEEA